MEEFSSLLNILAALAVGVVSPGPSFILVARTAASSTRLAGLYTALGMGAGGVVFAIAALLGLRGLLLAVPSMYLALKVVGGIYLVYLGARIWMSARMPLVTSASARGVSLTKFRAFTAGFTTQVCNPKTAVVYASVFAAFLPKEQTLALELSLVALVFIVEAGWYAAVALVLSAGRLRNGNLRCKGALDRVAGAVMLVLGLKLIWSAR
ncbi:threonine transporter [Rhizobacter sp. Root404]|nr:threonine transporter [Rhizobacter sp. Root404]